MLAENSQTKSFHRLNLFDFPRNLEARTLTRHSFILTRFFFLSEIKGKYVRRFDMKTGYLLPIRLPLFMENYTIAARHKYQDPRLPYQPEYQQSWWLLSDRFGRSIVRKNRNELGRLKKRSVISLELLKLRQEISYGRREGEGEKSRRRVVLIKRQCGGKKKWNIFWRQRVFRLATEREGGGERIRSRHNYAALRADLIILGEQPGGRPYVRSN